MYVCANYLELKLPGISGKGDSLLSHRWITTQKKLLLKYSEDIITETIPFVTTRLGLFKIQLPMAIQFYFLLVESFILDYAKI